MPTHKPTNHRHSAGPRLQFDGQPDELASWVRDILKYERAPWRHLPSVRSRTLGTVVMDVLQRELDSSPVDEGYRTKCIKSQCAVGAKHDVLPTALFFRKVECDGNSVAGGGFSDIYKGRSNNGAVCLKVIRLYLKGQEKDKVWKKFCHEALVWRQLRHPNILPLLGINNELFAPRFCLISPWMLNGNILVFLEKHPNQGDLNFKFRSIVEIAAGIEYLHNRDPQVVHADIRGANVLVTDDQHCVLADFGLSRIKDSHARTNSSDASKGSVHWLPPEMIEFNLYQSGTFAARDIYSFGCTIIEIFTGKPPFWDVRGDAAVIHAVMILRKKAERPSVRQLPETLDGLWAFIQHCMSFQATERPTSRDALKWLRAEQKLQLQKRTRQTDAPRVRARTLSLNAAERPAAKWVQTGRTAYKQEQPVHPLRILEKGRDLEERNEESDWPQTSKHRPYTHIPPRVHLPTASMPTPQAQVMFASPGQSGWWR